MKRAELVAGMNGGSALFYAMALTAFRPQYRARLFAIARFQRLKAILAWCGVPMQILQEIRGPALCDKALLNKVKPCLIDFRLGRTNLLTTRDTLLGYFGTPMTESDYLHACEYIEKMLICLEEEGDPVRGYAMEIASIIEAEHDKQAMNAAIATAETPPICDPVF